MKFLEDNSDKVAGSGLDLDVNWKDVDRKGMRLLEDNSDEVAGRVGSRRCCWKGWIRTLWLEGLEIRCRWKGWKDVDRKGTWMLEDNVDERSGH